MKAKYPMQKDINLTDHIDPVNSYKYFVPYTKMKPDSGARVREDISATQLYSFNNIALLL
jgi:hypothetical protein